MLQSFSIMFRQRNINKVDEVFKVSMASIINQTRSSWSFYAFMTRIRIHEFVIMKWWNWVNRLRSRTRLVLARLYWVARLFVVSLRCPTWSCFIHCFTISGTVVIEFLGGVVARFIVQHGFEKNVMDIGKWIINFLDSTIYSMWLYGNLYLCILRLWDMKIRDFYDFSEWQVSPFPRYNSCVQLSHIDTVVFIALLESRISFQARHSVL